MPYVDYQMPYIPELPQQYGFDREETKLFIPEMDHKTKFPQYSHDRYALRADPFSTLSPADVNHNTVFSDNSQRDIESPSGPLVNQWAVKIFSDFNMANALLEAMQKRGIDPLQSLKPAVAQLMGKIAKEYLLIAENVLMHQLELLNFCNEYGVTFPPDLVRQNAFPGISHHDNLSPRCETENQLYSGDMIKQKMHINKPIIKHSSLVEAKQLSSSSSGIIRLHPSPVEYPSHTVSPIEIARRILSPVDAVRPNASSVDAVRPNASSVDAVRPNASSVDAVRPNASPVDAVRPNASPVDAVRPIASPADAVGRSVGQLPVIEQGYAVETALISSKTEDQRNFFNSNNAGKQIVTVDKQTYAPLVSPISSDAFIDTHLFSPQPSIIVRHTEAENFPKSSTPKSFLENDANFASARSNWPPMEYLPPSDVQKSLAPDPHRNWHQLMLTPRKSEAVSQHVCNPAFNADQRQWQNSSASTDWRHGAKMLQHAITEPRFRDECCDERAHYNQVQDFQSHQGQFTALGEFCIAPESSLARQCPPHSNLNQLNFVDNRDAYGLPSCSSLPSARDRVTTSSDPGTRYAVRIKHLEDAPMFYGMNTQECLSSTEAKCADAWCYAAQPVPHQYPQMMCENFQDHNYIELTPPIQNTQNIHLNNFAPEQLFIDCNREVNVEPKFGDQVSQLEKGVFYELEKPDIEKWSATTSRYLPNDPNEKRNYSPMKASSDPFEGMWKYGSPIQNRNSVGICESLKGPRSSFVSIIRSQRSSTSSSQGVDSGYSLTNSCKSKLVKISGYHLEDSKTKYLQIKEADTNAAVLEEVRSTYSNDSLDVVHGENCRELSATHVADTTALTYPSCTTYSSNSSASILEEEILESSRRKMVFPVLCGEFYNHYENKNCSELKHSGLNLSFPADSPTMVAGIPQRLSTSSLPYELQVNFETDDCLSYAEDLSESVFLSSQIIQETSSYSDVYEKYNETQSGDHEQLDQENDMLGKSFETTSRGRSLSSSSCKYSLANPAQDTIECSSKFSSSVNSCTLSSDSTRCGVYNLWNNETLSQSEVFTTLGKSLSETSSEDNVDFSPTVASSHERYSSLCWSQDNKAMRSYGRASFHDGRSTCGTVVSSRLPSKAKPELGSDPQISVLLQRRARQAAPERRLSDVASPAATKDCFSKAFSKALETWQFHQMRRNKDPCVRDSPREIIVCSSQNAKKIKKTLNFSCNPAIDRFSVCSRSEPNDMCRSSQHATCKLGKNKFLETPHCQRSAFEKLEKRNANACSGSEAKILSRLKSSLESISLADEVNHSKGDDRSLLSMTLPVPRMFYKLTYAVPRTTASSDEVVSTELSELELISSNDDNSKPLTSDGSNVYDRNSDAPMLVRSCVGKVKALIRLFETCQL